MQNSVEQIPIVYELLYFLLKNNSCRRHCLVLNLLGWRISIERLMRSVMAVVMHKLFKPLADARPTAHPRVMEAVDTYLEGVEPLFDEVSLGIVDPTAQP